MDALLTATSALGAAAIVAGPILLTSLLLLILVISPETGAAKEPAR